MNPDKKKIMLVNPPGVAQRFSVKACGLPLGLAYLGAVLENNGYNVSVLDAVIENFNHEEHFDQMISYGMSIQDIKERIRQAKPYILGVSCIFTNKYSLVVKIAKAAKELGVPYVVLGGNHATAMANEILKNEQSVDFIILGEGERSFLKLTDALPGNNFEMINGLAYRKNGEIKINSNIDYIRDLDELPFPARDLFPIEKYFKIDAQYSIFKAKKGRRMAMITSRGCPAKCTYCSSSRYWGPIYRPRSPENILVEMKLLKEKYGVNELDILDDNFTFDNKRFREIANLMIGNNLNFKWFLPNGVALYALNEEMIALMKKAGCDTAFIAVESGNQNTLYNLMRKPLNLKKVPGLCRLFRKYKIKTPAFFVVGMPGETFKDIKDTFNFAAKIDIDLPLVNFATPFPGTELYKNCIENGYVEKDYYLNAEYGRANISTPNWSKEELTEFVKKNLIFLYLKLFLKNPLRFCIFYSKIFLQDPRNTFKRVRKLFSL